MVNGDATAGTYSEKKKRLIDENKQIQGELEAEVEGIKSNVVHYGKYTLIVGGIFVVAYYLLGLFFGSDGEEIKKKKVIYIPSEDNGHAIVAHQQEENNFSPLARMIMGAIASFLLAIAKEKLIKFLEEMSTNDTTKDTQPAA